LSPLAIQGVIYRDLKPENILLDRQGHVKLADFGLAKEGVNDPIHGASSLCGTPEYLSPEVLNRQGHGQAVDWWNLGMVLFEMLTGLPPWYTTDKSVLFERIRTAPIKFPLYLTRSAAHFMHVRFSPSLSPSSSYLSSTHVTLLYPLQLILNKDPACRLGSRSSEDIFNHPFFATIDWVDLNNRNLTPPFDPCKHLADDIDTTNFEKEFTQMPMYSMEDMEGGPSSSSSASALNQQTSPTKSSPVLGSGPFSQFSFGEDSYLEWIASR
jgi:serine/threonine protein kinase